MRCFSWALALALIFGAGRGFAQNENPPASAGTHVLGKHLHLEGIPNFGEVTPNLFRGGQPSAEGMQHLKKMKIDIVVDLRGSASSSEEAALAGLGMRYISIPSHCPFPKDAPWAHFLKVMRENEGKKVFVHCRLGDDRTGLAVAAYRISEQGWSARDALNEMKEFGFAGVHHMICPGLAEYVKGFPDRLREKEAFRELRR